MIAVRDGHDEVAQKLIDAGADTNIGSRGSEPPLLEALRRRNARLVRSLLDADADPNYTVQYVIRRVVKPAITLAVEWGDRSIIQDLIHAGADLNHCSPALTIAVQRQDPELVSCLLHAGADISNLMARSTGDTALAAAAKKGDTEMVRFLFEHGADPCDEEAINQAAKYNAEICDLLLDKYKSRYPQGHKCFGTKVLIRAIESGNTTIFKKMVEKGLDLTGLRELEAIGPGFSEFSERKSVFGHAITKAKGGDLRFLEIILRAGCSPEIVVYHKYRINPDSTPMPRVTAFLAAIDTGNISVVKLFINHGADVNFPPRMGVKRTPLQRAAECGYIEIVQLLINSGAEVNAPAAERGGGTALQFAAIGGYISIIGLLLNYHADVDAPASKVNGITELEGAAKNGRTDTVALLLNAGAGCYGKDRAQFERAMSLAREDGHEHICDMLNDYLANGKLSSGPESFDDIMNWGGED